MPVSKSQTSYKPAALICLGAVADSSLHQCTGAHEQIGQATSVMYRFDDDFPNWPYEKAIEKETMGKWFGGGADLDGHINSTFGGDVEAIGKGKYEDWKQNDLSCLAGLILMDQFTRNAYRGTPQM